MATGMSSPGRDVPRYVIPDFFTNPVLRPYLSNVQRWQGYIRFLGLPDRRDNPDIVIDRLFVAPLLTRRYVSPDENPESWAGEAEALVDALVENTPLVLLGDPGIGKSTLLNYVAWLLSRLATNALVERLGWRLPLPMVLRELPVRGVKDFDGLLDAFLSRDMSAPLRQDDGRYLKQALAEGKAFLLLDGIDELGDRTTREILRSAVFDGIARYPDCRWLLTSRIVGYDEVPFDTVRNRPNEDLLRDEPSASGTVHATLPRRDARGFTRFGRESRGGQVAIRYLAPFDDRRIAVFAQNWYARREAAAARARANADHLVGAVHADESILRLARVPNLLTMMALIHRIEATLPHGRALLYERIAEAYLESIDRFRGIESSSHDLPRKRGWLARVGFEMQRRCMSEDGSDGINILMDADTVKSWLSEEIGRGGAFPGTPSAEVFLNIVGRRSGLFLPRGEGLYAFVHLSFQEYFAAVALEREVTSLRWARGQESRFGFNRDTLADWAGQSVWRETFAFLFELLASQEGDDWYVELLDCIFGEDFSRLGSTGSEDMALNLGRLLARMVTNPRSGLSQLKRDQAVACCVSIQLRSSCDTTPRTIFADLLGDDGAWNDKIFRAIGEELKRLGSRELDFSGVQIPDFTSLESLSELKALTLRYTNVSDLAPLANLTELESIALEETSVSDFAVLKKLPKLQILDLAGTRISDLTSLAEIGGLQSLDLGRTQILDFSPLGRMTELRSLDLWGTEILDLSPLSKLVKLRSLGLGSTSISDWTILGDLRSLESLDLMDTNISNLVPIVNSIALTFLHIGGTQVSSVEPLEKLGQLRWLHFWRTPISDLHPLATLTKLESLYFGGTQVSDLSPLADLEALESLNLWGTQVSDLGPLANLTSLQHLDLNGTRVSDISPLASLRALESLILDNTPVSDLSSLANLDTLRYLNLNGTKVSGAAVEELRGSIPDLYISYRD